VKVRNSLERIPRVVAIRGDSALESEQPIRQSFSKVGGYPPCHPDLIQEPSLNEDVAKL